MRIEAKIGGGEYLAQLLRAGCADDRRGDAGARDQPRERDLRGRGVMALGDGVECREQLATLSFRYFLALPPRALLLRSASLRYFPVRKPLASE